LVRPNFFIDALFFGGEKEFQYDSSVIELVG